MPGFYVYCLFRPDGRPCYIGKGKGRRIWQHFQENRQKNPHLGAIIREAGGTLPAVVLHSGLDEPTAFEYERAFISAIGREYHGGTLVNLTDGGEGASGTVVSPEARAKVGENSKARWADPDVRAHILEAQIAAKTPETFAKMSASMRKTWADPAARERMTSASATATRAPEALAKRSDAAKRMWVENREHMVEAFKTATDTPEIRAKRAENAKKLWADPEHRSKVAESASEGARNQWKDPERRAKILAGMAEARRRREAKQTKTVK